MIYNKFYPNDTTAQGFKVTKSISSIDVSEFEDDPATPYYMGYVPYEDAPKFLESGDYEVVYNENENKFVFTSAVNPANHAWGFLARYTMSGYNSYEGVCAYDSVNEIWKCTDYGNNNREFRFINSGYLATYSVSNSIIIRFLYSILDTSKVYTSGSYLDITTTIDTVISWLKGDSLLTITISGSSYELDINEFNYNAKVWELEKESQDGYIRIGVNSMRWSDKGTGDSTSNPYLEITPFIAYKDIDDNIYYYDYKGQMSGTTIGFRIYDSFGTSAMTIDTPRSIYNYYTFFGLIGELTRTTLESYEHSGTFRYEPSICAFISYAGYHGTKGYVYDIYPAIDVRGFLGLLTLRLKQYKPSYSGSLVPVSTHYTTDINVNKYNESNSPTGEILNGAYNDIISMLRNWQLEQVNLYIDDFNVGEDLPPYEPPSPPGDDEESGDSIDNQYRYYTASRFITQYALTRSQLELFGQKLWTSWADTLGDPTEMWKNFKILLTGGDTGSVDISSALDFIVSLRVFPYDLTDSLMQNVDGIRLGTGHYPLNVGIVKKMVSLVQYVDFGSIFVPKPFGDFRDYSNISISVVLPYCGTAMLNPGDVIGRNLSCTYAIDLQSGACTAFVQVSAPSDTGERHYNVVEMSGQIGFLLPVTATNSGQIMSQRITDAANIVKAITAPINEAPILDAIVGGKDPDLSKASNVAPILGLLDESVPNTVSSIANALSRPAISCPSLGGGSGISAFYQPAQPYIQMRYGIYAEPDNYNHSVGKPSTGSASLSNYKGFTVCSNVDVSSLTCHADEKRSIKEFLESGVYL